MRACIYTRVSTQDQANEGFSLAAQLDRLRAYCDSQDWTITGIYTDEGISAKDTERPKLQEMLAEITKGTCDVVLVYKLDRLTRSVVDLHELLKTFDAYQVGFKSATEVFDTTSAMGRLFITLIAALAQWERENLAERTKMGQMEMTRQGKWSGGNPAFGYDYVDGQLIVNEERATVVREIFRRYTTGSGTRAILAWLNNPADPQPAPNRRWTLHALTYLLANPIYAGYVRYGYRDIHGRRRPNPIIEPGLHEPIITEAERTLAIHAKERRSKLPARSGTGTFAFSGVLYCAQCGFSMAGRVHYKHTKENSSPRRCYVCSERMHSGLCAMPQRTEAFVEERVLATIDRYYAGLTAQFSRLRAEQTTPRKAQNNRVEQRNKLQDQDNRLLDAYRIGAITLDELSRQREIIRADIAHLEATAQAAKDEVSPVDNPLLRELLSTLRMNWEKAEIAERKRWVRTIISRIELDKDGALTITYQ